MPEGTYLFVAEVALAFLYWFADIDNTQIGNRIPFISSIRMQYENIVFMRESTSPAYVSALLSLMRLKTGCQWEIAISSTSILPT